MGIQNGSSESKVPKYIGVEGFFGFFNFTIPMVLTLVVFLFSHWNYCSFWKYQNFKMSSCFLMHHILVFPIKRSAKPSCQFLHFLSSLTCGCLHSQRLLRYLHFLSFDNGVVYTTLKLIFPSVHFNTQNKTKISH